ncbi:hypothetical protein B9Z55_018769 [Caenorhabditis nigoni]|uniref:Uncharacterized protein n=2 Tax=Caenorhabditis nigoni TaxID=1611254 RepID=A0A2G5TFG5_9PELO|nr:hypothetical protein B9Z55_029086 [Caenorhabditis nigoni]PIC26084.1 hypothetical protein B9Z55_018769 [Caenorhabditis nigoni]
MSMDLDPVPGLPLLTTLYCNATTVKKKTTVKCAFPDELYTKKAFYGGPIGAGIGAVEIAILAVFVLLCFKIKHDITKTFLAIVYIPLGLSSICKVALAIYSIYEGAYGWWWSVLLMFFNFLYTTAVLCTSIGSVIFLAALIVIARRRENINICETWISYTAVLFFSVLLSGSYHFIAYQWNQLPASGLFFTYVLCTIGIIAELLVCLCVGLMCKAKPAPGTTVVVVTGDPVVDDARTRLAFGALAVLVMNIPQWFEIYVKITELFTPFLWDSDAQKKVFYTAQSIQLMNFDLIRLFLSLFMLIPLFITVTGRFAIGLLITRKPHPTPQAKATANKVFVASQNQPLLMETGEKKTPPPPTPPNRPVEHPVPAPIPAPIPVPIPAPITHQPPLVPIPHQVPVHQPHHQQQAAPPMYPGIGFAPGMLQLPNNMQTTIVYTPSMGYENANGQMHAEQFR